MPPAPSTHAVYRNDAQIPVGSCIIRGYQQGQQHDECKSMNELSYRQPVWWGEVVFPLRQGREWQLAGLELGITRQTSEWHIRARRTPEQSEDNHEWHQRSGNSVEQSQAELTRFVFSETSEQMRLLPRLADRSVVVRPVSPLFVPAGQETTFYVSTPVWLGCYTDGSVEPLLDIAVVIPRDTWFGPSPARGELCYASKVNGYTDLSQLSARPFRAVTPVHVKNMGRDSMPIERINIPAPFLPVYAAESGILWTPALNITRDSHSRQLSILIDSGISTEAGQVTQLTPARRGSDGHALIRVFDNFFD